MKKALSWLFDVLSPQKRSLTLEQKGELGESHVFVRLLVERLKGARILTNRIFKDVKGSTEVDAILVSPKGLFVIEVKHWQGWIYGDRDERRWTLVMGRKKISVQNPLKQNERHLDAVRTLLQPDAGTLHSLVVFSNADCEFKTAMPDNVIKSTDLMAYLAERPVGYLDTVDIHSYSNRILAETYAGKEELDRHVNSQRRS